MILTFMIDILLGIVAACILSIIASVIIYLINLCAKYPLLVIPTVGVMLGITIYIADSFF